MNLALQLAKAVLEGASPREFLKGAGRPYRRFKYTFDFGAGEGQREFYIELDKEMVAGLEDEELESFLIEFGKENIERDRIARDDWMWCIGAEEVPVGEPLKDWYQGVLEADRRYDPRTYLKSLAKRRTLKVGESISHGTLNSRDLITAALDTLKEIDPIEYTSLTSDSELAAYLENQMSRDEAQDFEDTFFHEQLVHLMQEHCPPLTYFGSHPGDGSDIGCWPYEEHEYEELSESERILYADEGTPLAHKIEAGFNNADVPESIIHGVVKLGYGSYACYHRNGYLLWQY